MKKLFSILSVCFIVTGIACLSGCSLEPTSEFSGYEVSDGKWCEVYKNTSGQTVRLKPLNALATDVALVGNNGYESIETAVSNATENQTVVVLTDVELSSPLTVSKDVKLKGNSSKITGSPVHFTSDKVDVCCLEFSTPSNANDNASCVYVNNAKEIKFENCKFTDTEWDSMQITSSRIEKLTIKGCTFKNEVTGYRYIHVEPRNGNDFVAVDGILEIKDNEFINVTTAYVRDSVVTITGFYFDNMEIGNNKVSGIGADSYTADMFWVCNGIDFSDLLDVLFITHGVVS